MTQDGLDFAKWAVPEPSAWWRCAEREIAFGGAEMFDGLGCDHIGPVGGVGRTAGALDPMLRAAAVEEFDAHLRAAGRRERRRQLVVDDHLDQLMESLRSNRRRDIRRPQVVDEIGDGAGSGQQRRWKIHVATMSIPVGVIATILTCLPVLNQARV
jgi:hypothetical protein